MSTRYPVPIGAFTRSFTRPIGAFTSGTRPGSDAALPLPPGPVRSQVHDLLLPWPVRKEADDLTLPGPVRREADDSRSRSRTPPRPESPSMPPPWFPQVEVPTRKVVLCSAGRRFRYEIPIRLSDAGDPTRRRYQDQRGRAHVQDLAFHKGSHPDIVGPLLDSEEFNSRLARGLTMALRQTEVVSTSIHDEKKTAEPGCKGRGLRKHAGCRGLGKTALQSCLVCFD